MPRSVTNETRQKIAAWEGVRLHAYDDATGKDIAPGQQVAGTLTIGIGHTGQDVRAGQTITRDQADVLLARDLLQAEGAVALAVKVPLNDRQFGALVSFTFNAGKAAFLGSSLLKKLNKGDYAAVPSELMKWTKTHINGELVTSQGLVKRRSEEAAYWSAGAQLDADATPPVMQAQQSQIPVPEAPKWMTPETVTSGIATVGGLGGLSGLVTGNGPFQYALAIIAVIAVAGAAYYFLRRRLAPQ